MKLYACLLLLTLAFAHDAAAQQDPPAQAPAQASTQSAAPARASSPDVMAAFRFFIGTWQPVVDPTAPPPKHSELYTFAPILDGTFLISQEIYRDPSGKIIYRDFGVYGVDPDTHQLFVHAYNSDGSIDRTRGIDSPPNTFVFLGTVYGSTRFRDYRYTMAKLDDNHMDILIELAKDGKFEKLSEKRYERKSKEASTEVQ